MTEKSTYFFHLGLQVFYYEQLCLFEKLTGYPHNLDLFTFQGTLESQHLK